MLDFPRCGCHRSTPEPYKLRRDPRAIAGFRLSERRYCKRFGFLRQDFPYTLAIRSFPFVSFTSPCGTTITAFGCGAFGPKYWL